MFGDISAWFYKALAGINLDPSAPAFKHIIIKPNVVGDLTFARASYDSIRGRIVSDWKIEGHKFHLTVTIPPNTTATVYFPPSIIDSAAVTEDGRRFDSSEGIRLVSAKTPIFEIGSGTYRFTAPIAQ